MTKKIKIFSKTSKKYINRTKKKYSHLGGANLKEVISNVIITTLGGENYEIDIQENETLEQLSKKIKIQMGIDNSNAIIQLFKDDMIVKDGLLVEQGVTNGTTLIIIIKDNIVATGYYCDSEETRELIEQKINKKYTYINSRIITSVEIDPNRFVYSNGRELDEYTIDNWGEDGQLCSLPCSHCGIKYYKEIKKERIKGNLMITELGVDEELHKLQKPPYTLETIGKKLNNITKNYNNKQYRIILHAPSGKQYLYTNWHKDTKPRKQTELHINLLNEPDGLQEQCVEI